MSARPSNLPIDAARQGVFLLASTGLVFLMMWDLWAEPLKCVAVGAALGGVVGLDAFVLPRRRSSRWIGNARVTIHSMLFLVVGWLTHWALPAFALLALGPLPARGEPDTLERTTAALVMMNAVAWALGAPALSLLLFTILAMISWVLSESRFAMVDQTLAELTGQHAQLTKAHGELQFLYGRVASQEKLAELGSLASGIVHEINNPMAFVTANIRSLAQDLPTLEANPAQFARDAAEIIPDTLDGLARISAIVDDLRRFSRGDVEPLAPVDLEAEVRTATRIASGILKKHRCEVVFDFAALPPLQGRPRQLSQVFLNLIVNAAQAMPDKGGNIWVTGEATGDGMQIKVRDDGRGIPPETVSKIFEPFFTTKPPEEGTGLGLSMVRSIVALHGGDIAVQSQVDHGTQFVIRLPTRPCDHSLQEVTSSGRSPAVRQLVRELVKQRMGAPVQA